MCLDLVRSQGGILCDLRDIVYLYIVQGLDVETYDSFFCDFQGSCCDVGSSCQIRSICSAGEVPDDICPPLFRRGGDFGAVRVGPLRPAAAAAVLPLWRWVGGHVGQTM